MSAITGMFLTDGIDVNYNLFKGMNNSLKHRGPDGSRIWVEGPVALGHQMLHTTPESIHEKLPFKDENSGLVITADARIDNREELAPLLKLKNSKKVPDSHFILKSYQKWEDKCPEKLLGDFAFAIWDPGKEQLFCARDHMGVKPFYYYLSDESFLFASEIKALFKIPGVPVKLNEIKIAHFLSNLFDNREITFYDGILRLSAAHKLLINSDEFKLGKYWKIDPESRIILESDSEYSKNFLNIFKEAVRCRLRSAFTLGSLLSGGLDSSSIVCTAREMILKNDGYPLKTFSVIFEKTPESDEQYYIDFIIKKGFLSPYYVNGDDYSPVFNLNPILWNTEGPSRASTHHFNYAYCNIARMEGVRVLLDGLGGDSTVSHGKRFPIDLMKNNQWIKVFQELKGTSKRLDISIYRAFIMELIKAYPNFFNKIIRIHPTIREPSRLRKDFIKEDFAQKIDLPNQIRSLSNKKIKMSEKAREQHYNSLNTGLHQYNLEEYDRISASFNLELRYPFYDVRLMEYCYAIPTEQKRKDGWNRFYMRHAMHNILPHQIQWRKNKITGGKSIFKNFKDLDKKYIENIIYKDNKKIEEYIDLNTLDSIYQSFKDKQNFSDFFDLWRAVSLGLWLQKNNFKTY